MTAPHACNNYSPHGPHVMTRESEGGAYSAIRCGGLPATELTASFGLEPEQEIRARALDVASYVIGDASGTVNGVAQHLIDLAEPLVDWIRDGQRPA